MPGGNYTGVTKHDYLIMVCSLACDKARVAIEKPGNFKFPNASKIEDDFKELVEDGDLGKD